MKNRNLIIIALLAFAYVLCAAPVFSQTTGLLKRTTYKSDKFDFGAGGTLSVIGAPVGSISIEGWQRNEIEISAEIEVQAASETDLAKLAAMTGFVLQDSLGRAAIVSVGSHLAKNRKKVKLPKNLVGLPFRIDYKIKVPRYCDIEVDGGAGNLHIAGVEGAMRINYLKSDAKLDLVGGSLMATFGTGTVEVTIPSRNWRARSAEVQLASGTLNVFMPANISSEMDATILRTGKIENAFADFKPRNRNVAFSERSIIAKTGIGGPPLKFTVGDGTLNLLETPKPQ